MTDVMRDCLRSLTEGEMPPVKLIRSAFDSIMDGGISQIQMAAFLTALKLRGERVEDIFLYFFRSEHRLHVFERAFFRYARLGVYRSIASDAAAK